jgi:hypothetical protein
VLRTYWSKVKQLFTRRKAWVSLGGPTASRLSVNVTLSRSIEITGPTRHETRERLLACRSAGAALREDVRVSSLGTAVLGAHGRGVR